MSLKPPLRFGTVPSTYTEAAVRKHFPVMYDHMKPFNVKSVREGIGKVKRGYVRNRKRHCSKKKGGEKHSFFCLVASKIPQGLNSS
jgi:hypothetical protein